MSSPPSSSKRQSSAFGLLDERIQRWIWEQEWEQLRDVQERAIPLILGADRDVIIAAATASGKTEAAFFPILTRILAPGKRALALYISPLKALINDQWRRLSELCERLEVQVTPWHGDISEARKRKFQKNPRGCLLITPESMEGLLIRHGHSLRSLLGQLEYIVVDELHAFLEDERGKQLQSLMHRIDVALERRVVRIGLSATLGEMRLASDFLRPGAGAAVELVESRSNSQAFKVIVKGYLEASESPDISEASRAEIRASATGSGRTPPTDHLTDEARASEASADFSDRGLWGVASDLFRLRGHNHLVFPNSRRNVELIADLLRERSDREGVPNEFWPHHGSLSRELREEAERALKTGDGPATAIATTTLELGVDIGAVKSVAQIGPAPSVASLRQRLGRSGRRPGEAAVLRAYCIESELTADSSLSDQLREGLLETTSQIRLLMRKWCEPPSSSALHFSTLVQQVLALIGQYSGMRPADLWQVLCESGVFSGISKGDFAELLKELGARDILQQEASGLLLPAPLGEQRLNHYSFLAAFVGDEEFRVVTAGKTLGTLPLSRPVTTGSYIIFGGRRWRVLTCTPQEKIIEVEAARSGKVPVFDGTGGEVHDEVRREMRCVLGEDAPIAFLDARANHFLSEARETFSRLGLARSRVISVGSEVRVLTWRGDRVNDTLATWLVDMQLHASNEGITLGVFDAECDRVLDALTEIRDMTPPRPEELAKSAQNLVSEKWDGLLPERLLRKGYGHKKFDIAGAQATAAEILSATAS